MAQRSQFPQAQFPAPGQSVPQIQVQGPNQPQIIYVNAGPQIELKSRSTYLLYLFFLGGLGAHNFYRGRSGVGVSQLLYTLFLGWMLFPMVLMGIWLLIEAFEKKDGFGREMV